MIILKSSDEIEKMRHSNKLVAGALLEVKKNIDAGITTFELDRIAENYIVSRGAKPAFKGYRGFPCTLCASVNDEVVHGIPSKNKLKAGDIISLDLGSFCEGYYGDAAITVPVGQVSSKIQNLLKVTEKSLYIGIEQAKVGNRLSDISYAIQLFVEKKGFSVVREFVGHGIGTSLHEEPQIPNFGPPGEGPLLKEGMVLAIEPMVNLGGHGVLVKNDKWTVVTADRSLSAHFEHSIAVRESGGEVLSVL